MNSSGIQEVCLCFFMLRFLSAPVPQVYPLHSMPEKINSVNPASILALHVSWLTRLSHLFWSKMFEMRTTYGECPISFLGGALLTIPDQNKSLMGLMILDEIFIVLE